MGARASKKQSEAAPAPQASVESVSACTSRTIVEERIEHSRSHWSELTQHTEPLSMKEVAAITLDNEEVFKEWQSHPEWGFFFQRPNCLQDFEVGEKFAEGAQAEIFDVHVLSKDLKRNEKDAARGVEWVLKVFKEGTLLRDLQHQWPHGLFKHRAIIRNHMKLGKALGKKYESDVNRAMLLEDGRFAFLMKKEDEDLRSLIDRQTLKTGRGDCGPFSNTHAAEYMFDVALGVDILHGYDIIHRDLKAANVLYYKRKRRIHCVVSDYECSIGVVGTGWWRAPEILQALKEGNVRAKPELFSKAADIYSLGMTFYEIATGKQPFQGEEVTRDDIIGGKRPHVPEFVDEWVRTLLHRCWEPNCDVRPSIEDILGIFGVNASSNLIKRRLARRLELLREDASSTTSGGGLTSS